MKNFSCILFIILSINACTNKNKSAIREEWIDDPVSEWPELVFTNDVEFTDTTYSGLANAFLVDTGKDTLGITCKHIFLAFTQHDLPTIDLGQDFVRWKVYQKGNRDKFMLFDRMINKNSDEMVDAFNTLKSRDWLLFGVNNIPEGFTPLKIRHDPAQKGEYIYAIGWPYRQKEGSPSLVKMEVFSNEGPYYYVTTISENVDPAGRSGSPVIDANGYLVGIVSGSEGRMGVIGNVSYLNEFLK